MLNYTDVSELDFDSKIHINCGYCGLLKGCVIRKTFIETAKQFSSKGFSKKFKLKCPFEIQKYKDGTEIKFTVAYGAHNVRTEWDCEWDCDYCNRTDCRDGIITFKNKRYKGTVELKGKIEGYIERGKYIINVAHDEFNKVKNNFNRYDMLMLHKISDSFGWAGEDFIPTFVTKERFILKQSINTN